ncbi:MAG: D-2-hydroxyacid dehydrogenase [Bacteroidaceae bacterium]|nr:D-2-hydroxyacid dehydrogenase [Bacteroidaceae bacterium]
MKIVVLEADAVIPKREAWSRMCDLGEVVLYPQTTVAEVVDRLADADIAITNKVVIDKAVMSQLPKLKYIGVLATGYNVVDIEEARNRGIVVTNIPAYSTDSVAQMVWAHVLNITNRVGYYAEQNRNGRWAENKYFCYYDFQHDELAGKTFGIVGLGNIGMAVARIALAFGMKVIAYTSKTELPEGISRVDMDSLFRESDVISLHCPLTKDTQNLVNRNRLRQMKPTAILINTSRGLVIDEQAVADALNDGTITAFGCDVLSSEPPKANNPLLTARNSFITPHIAWATVQARKRLVDICTENIEAFINRSTINQVN